MKDNYILPFLWMKGETREVIREEIEKIDECGIKAICLESRPHPDFMGKQWWEDLEFIIQEAKKRAMKIWILDDAHFPTGYANGLIKSKYPERKKRYLRYNEVNVWGKSGKVTVNIHQMLKPLVNFTELDKPIDAEERARNKLVAVTAYPLREEDKLDEDGVIDLTDKVKGDYLTWKLPKDNYRVYVVYETCTDGGKADYINMMDKESVSTLIEAVYEPHFRKLGSEFGKTIAGFFSDEPEIGNEDGFSSDTRIGKRNMVLPWSESLKTRLQECFGDAWRKNLVYLWSDTAQMKACPQVRYRFMDIVTTLYQENFSMQLGRWCEEHDVEYIGHVVEDDNLHQRLGNGTGHFFRAMAGQHMAGIDVIGDQVTIGDRGYRRSGLFQRDGAFFHYALAKLGASEGHLNPAKKGRTMCELFGASGWQTGVRDMKFILDHLLVRGINYLVPHAFSMSDYPDMDCPPHFYARGRNPQFKYFAQLMKYANRMCDLLNGGMHVASTAVLYPAECEWSGGAMLVQEPARQLQEHQIEFDFVSADMLGSLQPDGSFVINGQTFQTLIIPACEFLPVKVYRFIKENPDIPVIIIDNKPIGAAGGEIKKAEFDEVLKKMKLIPLCKLGTFLQGQKYGEIRVMEKSEELTYYHYRKEQDIYVFHNESSFEKFRGKIRIPLKNGAVYYDGMKNSYFQLPILAEEGQKSIEIELQPLELGVILDVEGNEYPDYSILSEQISQCRKEILTGTWKYSTATGKQYPEFSDPDTMDKLLPISDILPEFSGHICYEKEIEAEDISGRTFIEFTEVYEVAELWINEVCAGVRMQPPYLFDITEQIRPGTNQIRVVVTSTADRDQINYAEPFIILDHHVTEPVGLAGEVNLYLD